MIGDVNDEQGTLIFGRGNIVFHDPYQHSKLMRSRRDLRLKRGVAWAMDRKTGKQSNEGPRVQATFLNQAIPKKALKSVDKGASGSSKKKKVSFGLLEDSFTNSEKYVSCITDEILGGG